MQEHSNVAKFRDAELEVRLGLVALVALVALMWRLCGAGAVVLVVCLHVWHT